MAGRIEEEGAELRISGVKTPDEAVDLRHDKCCGLVQGIASRRTSKGVG
jgi:hypothetical protein